MELEHQERIRDCKIEKGKDLISHKAEIKATLELSHENQSNALTLEHYQLLREIQTTQKDKHQLLKDSQLKKDKNNVDSHFAKLSEELAREMNKATKEIS